MANRKNSKKYYFSVEGETEEWYLLWLRDLINSTEEAALGESGINIRMINQGPDELNIIFGVDNKDFKEAIRVLYNSFVTK